MGCILSKAERNASVSRGSGLYELAQSSGVRSVRICTPSAGRGPSSSIRVHTKGHELQEFGRSRGLHGDGYNDSDRFARCRRAYIARTPSGPFGDNTIWDKLQEHESTANTNYGEKRIMEARAKGLQNLEERTKKLQAVIQKSKRVKKKPKIEVSSDEDEDVSDELASEHCDEDDSEEDWDTPWILRANRQHEHDTSAKRVVPRVTERVTRASNRSAHDDDKGNGSDGRKEPKTRKRKADGEALQNRPQTRRNQADVPPPKKQAPKRQTKKK